MSDVEILDAVKESAKLGTAVAYETCQNPDYNRIFQEEASRAGLGDTFIEFQTTEETDVAAQSEIFEIFWGLFYQGGASFKACPEGGPEWYVVLINTCVAEQFPQPERYVRKFIRHELAHIRNGDCDVEYSGVSPPMRFLDILMREARTYWHSRGLPL